MKLVFSVQDLKVGYGHPHLSASVPEAIRSFTQAINNDPNSLYAKHPADFVLVHIGTFDPSTGSITPLPNIQVVCTATDLIES